MPFLAFFLARLSRYGRQMRTRELSLDVPVDVHDLWQRLATALPGIVRLLVRHRVDQEASPTAALPELRGPEVLQDGTTRSYECGERWVFGHVHLLAVVRDGRTFRSIALTVVSATVSTGLIVLSLWDSQGPAEAIERLSFKCDDAVVDELLTLLRAAVSSDEPPELPGPGRK